jgi:hypothetical protein
VKQGKDNEVEVGPTDPYVVDMLSYTEGGNAGRTKSPPTKYPGDALTVSSIRRATSCRSTKTKTAHGLSVPRDRPTLGRKASASRCAISPPASW